MNIQGQAALVTGGGSGLGEATARELARLGARVAVLDLNLENAQRVAKDIGGVAVQCNVSDPDSMQAAVEAAASAGAERERDDAELLPRGACAARGRGRGVRHGAHGRAGHGERSPAAAAGARGDLPVRPAGVQPAGLRAGRAARRLEPRHGPVRPAEPPARVGPALAADDERVVVTDQPAPGALRGAGSRSVRSLGVRSPTPIGPLMARRVGERSGRLQRSDEPLYERLVAPW